MQTQITITNTRHNYGECFASIGGVGGYNYQPETTTVEWSDGTRLIVEDSKAKAIYRGTKYPLDRIHTSLHNGIVEYWSAKISKRLERDAVPATELTDRVRAGWQSTSPSAA